ncbi:hypothetical protein KL86DES1_20258 [uncultured Desulfovibrio sp.]|uniref:Uncharacterized protein n=1 Tax=uncultured Desulfovibrio sp. TaxID=167968 RepID=A0A212L3E4_9BACT|nr:hypothetical protein KL86DES1_20258 [uncultured Desulfovibrio sp.]VZH33159.1 conserved protein of unknown function [Desulfovibrio sp. 86]
MLKQFLILKKIDCNILKIMLIRQRWLKLLFVSGVPSWHVPAVSIHISNQKTAVPPEADNRRNVNRYGAWH